jgi:chemotaxis protein methyltransferase CheR
MAFTFFFRDAETLEMAVGHALPALSGQAFIRIWDAGCAHGPEPYTLAMMLREQMSDFIFRNVRIHASDVDAQFGPNLSRGIYSEGEIKRIPAPFRERYFRPAAPGRFQVEEELRAKMTFIHHDLLSLTPIRDDFSLIFCKNVLLHFHEPQRIEVLRMFHRALRPGGLLVMEHTQKMPSALDSHFSAISNRARIYQKMVDLEPVSPSPNATLLSANREVIHKRIDRSDNPCSLALGRNNLGNPLSQWLRRAH